jgi:hypothetical protein
MLLMVIAMTSVLAPITASASPQKGKVPGKPRVLMVEGIFRSSNFVDVKVTIELPPVSSRNRITGSEISLGKRKCTIRSSRNSCTIKKVRHSIVPENVTARSKTSAGFGKSSARVRFMPTTTRWIRSGYSSTGVKFPNQSRAISNTRVLPNSSNERWAKFQAFGNLSVSARSASRVASSSSDQTVISFVTDGVIGLALPSGNVMQSGSGLYAVRSDGTTIDAVRNGSAQIRDFYTAPNNRFYVVFNGPTEITVGSPLCVLAEVDELSGNPRCVDEKLASVNSDLLNSWSSHLNPSVQFDDLGNIYYSGNVYANDSVCDQGSQCPNQIWPQKLRKSTAAGVSDLMSDYVQNSDYMVLGDGTVLITGRTSTTQVAWTRKISTTGVLSAISATQGATFLKKFADGNVYFGVTNGSSIKRYLTATGAVDPRDWVSSMFMSGQSPENPYFSTGSICGLDILAWGAFCQGSVTSLKYAFNVGNSHTFGVNGFSGSTNSRLVQYFPTPEKTNTSITNITVAAQAGDKLVLAGTNAQGVNSLVVYDPLTFQETVLIDASNEIEVYSMAYVRSTGKLMFNGLVFATNRYVMGEVTIP